MNMNTTKAQKSMAGAGPLAVFFEGKVKFAAVMLRRIWFEFAWRV